MQASVLRPMSQGDSSAYTLPTSEVDLVAWYIHNSLVHVTALLMTRQDTFPHMEAQGQAERLRINPALQQTHKQGGLFSCGVGLFPEGPGEHWTSCAFQSRHLLPLAGQSRNCCLAHRANSGLA